MPEAYILKSGAKINDLQEPTAKMSKSAASFSGIIDLMDSPDVNLKKFKSAVTDTGKEVIFDEKNKPGISNLLTIHSSISGKSIKELESEFEGKGYGDFKLAVAEVVIEHLNPIRDRALELLKDESELLNILHGCAERAAVTANKTLTATYKALGLVI